MISGSQISDRDCAELNETQKLSSDNTDNYETFHTLKSTILGIDFIHQLIENQA